MEQLNQRVSASHSSRLPLVFFFVFCALILGLACYTTFDRSKSPKDTSSEEKFTPNIEYGRTMSRRLSELGLPPPEKVVAQNTVGPEENFWDSYFKYLALVEPSPAPMPVLPAPRPASSAVTTVTPQAEPASPSPQELLQEQLRNNRASALLQALKANTTVNASTTASSNLKNQAAEYLTGAGGGPMAGGAGAGAGAQAGASGFASGLLPNGLSPNQQWAWEQGRVQLAGGLGNVSGVGINNSSVSAEQTLAAYQGLTNNDTLLKTQVETVLSPYLLRQGALIPCVLLTGINSDLPGLVQAQVTEDVFDTPLGHHLLIPKGSKIIGQYAAAPMLGQERLMLAFNRVIFPDGKAMGLGAMPGSSPDGYAGFDSEVDTHFWRLMGNAILLGGVTAGVSLSVDDNVRDSDGNLTLNGALTQSLGQSMGRVLTNIIERNMAISPTLQVHPGFLFNVTLTKDIYFPSAFEPYAY